MYFGKCIVKLNIECKKGGKVVAEILRKLYISAEILSIALVTTLIIKTIIRFFLNKKRECKKVLDKFEEVEKEKKIVSNKEIFTDIGSKYKQLIIDESKKKIYYFTALKGNISNFNVKEFDYKDIAGFEVVQNRKTELLVVGDYVCNFSKSKADEIYMQGFRILVNDIKSPNIEIVVTHSIEGECKNSMPCIKEWTSRINMIMQEERNKSKCA